MTRLLYLLFVLSGAAGLIYESIWTRYLGLFVGHDAYAQIIVLVIFLGGMSAGAVLVSRRSERLRQPLRAYAVVELAVGCIGLAFHDGYQWATAFAHESLYPLLAGSPLLHAAKWSIAGALILPQSLLLGATFPLMSAGVLRLRRAHEGRSLSLLYFANSLGAAAGVLVAGFYLVAWSGLPGTLLVAAILNLLVAGATIVVAGRMRPRAAPAADASTAPAAASDLTPGRLERLLLFTTFGTAVASFAYEIDWIRMLALVLGSATHAFELMLSAFILGLALGAFWIRSRIDRMGHPVRTLGIVQWLMGLLALATLPVYVASFHWTAELMGTFARSDPGYTGFTVARYALCLLIMLPATFCAGMTLPLITRTLMARGGGERAIGRVYAWNTFGSIVGVVLAGLVLLPAIGVKATLLAGAALDMALGVTLLLAASERSTATRRLAYGLAAALGLVLLLAGAGVPLEQRLLTSGVYRTGGIIEPATRDVLFYRDGRTASVSSVRVRATQQITLATNGKPDAALGRVWFRPCDATAGRIPLTGDAATQTLTAIIPMAHMPSARTAAVIGYGSGMTSHVLLGNPRLREVVTVEIEREMVEGARLFHPANRRAAEDPRSRLVYDDARSYFASEHRQFDLIVSEPSNPWVSGVSGLFTTEFYGRIRNYLSDDGVLGQWIHTYELSDGLVLSVLAALHENFRSYEVYVVSGGDLLVVASKRPRLPQPDWSVIREPGIAEDLCHFQPITVEALEGLRLIGRRELAPLLGNFDRPNSDFYPVLDLGAERRRYLRDAARGFLSLSADWYNLLASVSGQRQGPGEDTSAVLPEAPRNRARALGAQLRRADPSHSVAEPGLEQAWYLSTQFQAMLAGTRRPSSWQLWLDQMQAVALYRNGGVAGAPDDELYRDAARFAERFGAPQGVRDVIAFRRGIAVWDFRMAADAADRLIPLALREHRWIAPDELRDGAVMAHLHLHQVAAARAALDALAPFSGRPPDHLVSLLLDAYVRFAEWRQAKLGGALARVGP